MMLLIGLWLFKAPQFDALSYRAPPAGSGPLKLPLGAPVSKSTTTGRPFTVNLPLFFTAGGRDKLLKEREVKVMNDGRYHQIRQVGKFV